MQIFLFEALKANRCDYVKVLLEQKVVLDNNILDDLYIQVCEHFVNCNLFRLCYIVDFWLIPNWVYFQTVLCTECGVGSPNCSHIRWNINVCQNLLLFLNMFVLYSFLKYSNSKFLVFLLIENTTGKNALYQSKENVWREKKSVV